MLHQECTKNNQPETKNNNGTIGEDSSSVEESGRERLKRHRREAAGRVRVPEIWGQEDFLKEWVDCSAFDSSLVPDGIVSARKALVEECQKSADSPGTRIENRCQIRNIYLLPSSS